MHIQNLNPKFNPTHCSLNMPSPLPTTRRIFHRTDNPTPGTLKVTLTTQPIP
jgi:hypothetical protein